MHPQLWLWEHQGMTMVARTQSKIEDQSSELL
jgi:hypothetical protein